MRNVQQWEYLVVSISKIGFRSDQVNDQGIAQELNEYGAQGWELVEVVSGTGINVFRAIFKRPV